MEFEDILKEVGSYGLFQKNLVYLFLCPICTIGPFFSMALIFVVSVPDHWCSVPDLTFSNLTTEQRRLLVEVPENPQCSMHNLNFSEFSIEGHPFVQNGTEALSCKYGWEYDQTNFDATAATKWNMVCSDSHYTSFILTLQNIGGLIATPIYGSMADKYGRKITFFIAIAITLSTELLSILTPSFVCFALLKTVSGAAMPSILTLPYILVSEIVGPEHRVFVSGVINTCWTFGMCVVPLVVYLSRSWIVVGIVNTFSGLLILLYWKYVPESPVWMISVEKYDEAFNVMMSIGIKNEKIPDEISLMKKLRFLGEKIKQKKEEENKQNIIVCILKYPQLRKIFFIITFCWITSLTTYNGLQYNVTKLEGNEFLNFFLLSIVEAPGNILFWILMERLGRRWTASVGYLITGLVCVLPITGWPYCEVVSSVLGKLIISGVFMVTDQQACELYPTVFRSFGIGISKTICKATTLLVPYLIYLAKYGKSIPFIAISLLSAVAAVTASFLPESIDENLPQNISDTEEFGKDQRFFSFNRKKRPSHDCTSPPIEEFDTEDQPAIFTIQNSIK